ncbi:hypothetical protein [Microbacterium murale]|uniref:Uncharacterized protein n=1 Tax=Microbacterium murale TaxID=1081040 RepID=A0ABU0PAX3_9MICO|nr:hypothetical protein [Microbacterium murale]MDQ0644498.1 hypothetical protein [Microbacterium murale]
MELEAPVGHVVHLLRSFDVDTGAPETIGFGKRTPAVGRWVIWALLALASIGTAILLINLWTSDSPWWFNVIFTLMPALFIIGCAVAVVESGRLSRMESLLTQRWAQIRQHATLTEGRVTDRAVSLLDNGGASSFALMVTDAAGVQVHARWHRSNPDNQGETLLQTQIPAIGSKVRIWAVGMPDAEAPIIVEALDPSVVQ